MSDMPVFKIKRGGDDRSCVLKKVVTAEQSLELPKYIDGMYVTVIGGGAFKKSPRLKSVIIPDTVTAIAPKAFAGSNIESIVIPRSVTAIGDKAFDKCVYLREITVENPAAKLGKSLFSGCYNIRRASLPVSAFVGRWFTTVEDLTVTGNGIISENMFKDCGALKSVTVGEGITELREKAFCDCTALARVVLPDSLSIIEEDVFEDCGALKSFTVPKGVTEIWWEAFSGCAIESFDVDKDNPNFRSDGNCIIEIAEKKLIAGCANSVIPDDGSVNYIEDGAFSECKELNAIVIPSAVKTIGDHVFVNCVKLESIVLSEGVEEICDFAFAGCSHLEAINLPSTVKELGFGIFGDCEWLSDVFFNGTIAAWRDVRVDKNFGGNSSFVLHCTDGDVEDYK